MGELAKLRHQESHVFMRDFRGCKWTLFHFFDFHKKLNIRKLLSDKKHLETSILFQGNNKLRGSYQTIDSTNHRKEKSGKMMSEKSKSLLKSFIPSQFYRKQGQKQKILPLSPKLLRTISIHHLECNKYVITGTENTGTGNTGTVSSKDSSSRSESVYRLPKYKHSSLKDIDVKKAYSFPSEMRHNWNSVTSTDPDAGQINSNDSKSQIEEKNIKQMISMDGVLHKIPYGQKPPENSKILKNSKSLNLHRSASVNYERERGSRLLKRSRSLSDSVDRYAHLFHSLSLSRESASKTMQTGTRLTGDHESFKETKEINPVRASDDSLSKENALQTVQEDMDDELIEMEGVDYENGTIEEMSEKCEVDLDLRREKEEEIISVDEKVEEDSLVSKREKESPVSVLESSFSDDPLTPAKFQNFQENELETRNLNSDEVTEIYEYTPPNLENLSSEPVLDKDPNLENLMELFEDFGFDSEEFLEIFDSLLREVQHEINDFTNFEFDIVKFEYDENMSLDQNLLYALTHESLHHIFEKYFSNGKITSHISAPLEKVLIKDLWQKMNCFVNSKISFSGNNNLIDKCVADHELKGRDGWLDLARYREILGVELGSLIFQNLLDELILELC